MEDLIASVHPTVIVTPLGDPDRDFWQVICGEMSSATGAYKGRRMREGGRTDATIARQQLDGDRVRARRLSAPFKAVGTVEDGNLRFVLHTVDSRGVYANKLAFKIYADSEHQADAALNHVLHATMVTQYGDVYSGSSRATVLFAECLARVFHGPTWSHADHDSPTPLDAYYYKTRLGAPQNLQVPSRPSTRVVRKAPCLLTFLGLFTGVYVMRCMHVVTVLSDVHPELLRQVASGEVVVTLEPEVLYDATTVLRDDVLPYFSAAREVFCVAPGVTEHVLTLDCGIAAVMFGIQCDTDAEDTPAPDVATFRLVCNDVPELTLERSERHFIRTRHGHTSMTLIPIADVAGDDVPALFRGVFLDRVSLYVARIESVKLYVTLTSAQATRVTVNVLDANLLRTYGPWPTQVYLR